MFYLHALFTKVEVSVKNEQIFLNKDTDGSLDKCGGPNGNVFIRSWKPKKSQNEHKITPSSTKMICIPDNRS